MASHGIVFLRQHGFGGRRETRLQRAWRERDFATVTFLNATRGLAHTGCEGGAPCRRCQRIAASVLAARAVTTVRL